MLTDVALKALNQKRKSTRLRTATACMFASCLVARSPFGWITGSTDAARRSVLAGMDGTESHLPLPERSVSTRSALLARDGRRRYKRRVVTPITGRLQRRNGYQTKAMSGPSRPLLSRPSRPGARIQSHPLNLGAELLHRSHLSSRVRARTRAGAGGRIASCIRGSRRAGGCTRTSAVAGRGVTAGRTRAA